MLNLKNKTTRKSVFIISSFAKLIPNNLMCIKLVRNLYYIKLEIKCTVQSNRLKVFIFSLFFTLINFQVVFLSCICIILFPPFILQTAYYICGLYIKEYKK